ncbi:MAG: erythromycin esterase family protein [Planctomycetota bacterium]
MNALPSLLLAAVPFANQEAPQPDQVDWLRRHAIPLRGVEAGQGFDDLEPLRDLVGDARVVALGESTHGSREQFQLKHRLVEFLVSEMGFNTFSIEASMPESYAVDDFVTGGTGDPVDLIRGMYFWTWSTEEVLAMVEWMRAFNADNDERHVRFTGFDMQTPDVAARIVADNVERVDPAWAGELRGRYDEMMNARPKSQGWAPATASLDPALVAGQTIAFTGQLRSDDATYVALWFRADSHGKSVAFLNTQAQHRDAEGWVRHEIELDIPDDIDNVNFGLIHSGGGTAWFDDLELLVDGEAVEPDGFDFAMETAEHGFPLMSREYKGRLDTAVAAEGKASFRIDSVANQGSSDDWTPATASLAPELIAGHSIVFAGKLRTEGARYASLWFRADLDGQSVAFMNTQPQHEDGGKWIDHRVELDIPDDIDNVNFGLIHSGGGSAWFDDLSLTVDGEPMEVEGFDFGMETETPGFPVMKPDYKGALDRDVVAAGEASFRIDRVAPLTAAAMDAGDARRAAEAILDELSGMEAELAAELGSADARWTIQMARVVAQCMESRDGGGGAVRDRCMAENVLWILEQDPDAKLILWAHNGHVANDTVWMGRHLERELGDDYLPVGFATSRGEYRAVARSGSRGLSNHALQATPAGSIESFFEAADLPLAALDLRQAEDGSPASGWLTEPRPMRSVGALEMDQQFFSIETFPKFEVLLYVAETTGAWPLRTSWSSPPSRED